jgi:transposase-like protein
VTDDLANSFELLRAYRTLGVQRSANESEVKQAYRDLAQVWHPDRFGHDARLRAKAEDQLKNINAAFDLVKAERARRTTTPTSKSAPRSSAQHSDAPVAERWLCPDCRSEVTKGDKRCRKCGQKLVFEEEKTPASRTGWRCPDCRSEVTKGDKRCRKCGQKLVFEE